MYAIVETGGKQYRVEPGLKLKVEKLEGEVGGKVQMDKVRLIQGDKGLVIGRPWVDRGRVLAEIVAQGRTRSIMVFKKKRRKNYRRTKGHRQSFTEVRITGIEAN
jgi:large subunit ribosomal protein L21